MSEKEFLELLDKATYFAAFSMLSPELEAAFLDCANLIQNILAECGDSYSDETQEWGLQIMLRKAVDEYITQGLDSVYFAIKSKEECINEG
jgi:hypothetical protein